MCGGSNVWIVWCRVVSCLTLVFLDVGCWQCRLMKALATELTVGVRFGSIVIVCVLSLCGLRRVLILMLVWVRWVWNWCYLVSIGLIVLCCCVSYYDVSFSASRFVSVSSVISMCRLGGVLKDRSTRCRCRVENLTSAWPY